jgi:hypothetical protein
MDDSANVSFGESFTRIDHVLHRTMKRDATCLRERLRKRTAVEILHDDVRTVLSVTPDIEHARNVLTSKARRCFGFLREALDGRRIVGTGVKKLQRDLLIELDVRRLKDHAHSAPADDFFDAKLRSQNLTQVGRGPRYGYRDLLARGFRHPLFFRSSFP